jgi:hypothetical protein
MTNLSASKSIRRNICRTIGHVWELYKRDCESGNICSRCKKRELIMVWGKATYLGSLPARVDIPVGTTFFDMATNSMIINNGTSWQILK